MSRRFQFSLNTLLVWATLLPPAVSLLFMGGSEWYIQLPCRLLSGTIIGFCVGTAFHQPLLWSIIGFLVGYPPLACLCFVIFGAVGQKTD